MLCTFKNFVQLAGRVIRKCEVQNSFPKGNLTSLEGDLCPKNQIKNFHNSTSLRKTLRPEYYQKRAAVLDAKKESKIPYTLQEDVIRKREEGYFPTVDLPNTLFNNVAFKDLPYIQIIATRNNTKLNLIDNGTSILIRSGGTEGFKNARKGTNIAAQTAGTALGYRALKRGYKTVKILVSGLGAGRLSAIKGLQLSGMNIVSITDNTVFMKSGRARKQRRL